MPKFNKKEATVIPRTQRGPKLSTIKKAKPAAGQTGLAKPGGIAKKVDKRPNPQYPAAVTAITKIDFKLNTLPECIGTAVFDRKGCHPKVLHKLTY